MLSPRDPAAQAAIGGGTPVDVAERVERTKSMTKLQEAELRLALALDAEQKEHDKLLAAARRLTQRITRANKQLDTIAGSGEHDA